METPGAVSTRPLSAAANVETGTSNKANRVERMRNLTMPD
jgi:hypothetical protein